ncbi:uncharacterized protein LOC111627696 [Centruroides sculpturatus]|uniref:uncharacterized protein LOC111627696 n=1 Tax=Centruroides sculpturatus TaxID=218467 RepID=UPI000C6E7A81|nr:uncharacterized protein LOC111627696 [Centruroides sculpturatus]
MRISFISALLFIFIHGTSAARKFIPDNNNKLIYQESLDYPDYIFNKTRSHSYGYEVDQKDRRKGNRDNYPSASGYNDASTWQSYGNNYGGGGEGFSMLGGGKGGGGGFGLGSGKGKQGAKALLAVVIPLALLAVLGPLMASQVMLPLAVASTSLPGTLPTGRRRRALRFFARDADKRSEFFRRLEMLRSIQRYLAEVGEENVFREDLMLSYLRCSGLLAPENHCLERLACEFTYSRASFPRLEQEVVSIVFYNIMKNKHIDESDKQRLRKAARVGKYKKRNCSIYYCNKIDSNIK